MSKIFLVNRQLKRRRGRYRYGRRLPMSNFCISNQLARTGPSGARPGHKPTNELGGGEVCDDDESGDGDGGADAGDEGEKAAVLTLVVVVLPLVVAAANV